MEIKYYEHPQCEVIEMQMAEVIADSGNPVSVSDPWGENSEEEW